jgi:hypothetical protein
LRINNRYPEPYGPGINQPSIRANGWRTREEEFDPEQPKPHSFVLARIKNQRAIESNREISDPENQRGGTMKSIEKTRETETILAGDKKRRARIRGSEPAKHQSTERRRTEPGKEGRPWGAEAYRKTTARELRVERPVASPRGRGGLV